MGFTKLHESIVHSSIWSAPDATRLVWITMLAIKDRNGEVLASLPGLAHLAHVDIEACEKAIAYLSSPDPYSRTKEHEGRRIEEIDGGWVVLNAEKYRELQSVDDRREKDRLRQQRKRDRDRSRGHVMGHAGSAKSRHADTDPDADTDPEGEAREDDQDRSRSPLVALYLSKFPEVPEEQVEASVMKLRVGWPGVDLAAAITEAWKAAPPDLAPFRVHTWVNRQCDIMSRRLQGEQDVPQTPPVVRAALDAVRAAEAPERASREDYERIKGHAAGIVTAGEAVPPAVSHWIHVWNSTPRETPEEIRRILREDLEA